MNTNLLNTNLLNTNLLNTNLLNTNLLNTNLFNTNLLNANLLNANLLNTNLLNTNLLNTNLLNTNLLNTNLFSANLLNTNLFGTNLFSAKLFSVSLFSEIYLIQNYLIQIYSVQNYLVQIYLVQIYLIQIYLLLVIILMAKYQKPRMILNNPEKNVPGEIKEQFFLAIKTANIDQIRDFSIKYKNKYNLIESGSKPTVPSTKENPFHVVLNLDEKIASDFTKLQIMKFLDQMGAPIDLPDGTDVWPIHLAAALQSEEIIDFFLEKKVSLERKDSSNNTPLHYAINGKEITCSKPPTISSLVPSQKLDKLPLNKTLEDANTILMKFLSNDPNITPDIIHITTTLMNIRGMYAEDKIERNLKTEVISIFSDIAMVPTYSGGIVTQQSKLEQLVERMYNTIIDGDLRGVTSALNIVPNNSGWGPQIPTNTGGHREPNNTEKILEETKDEILENVKKEYDALKNDIANPNTNVIFTIISKTIPDFLNDLDANYLDKLIFCSGCNGDDVDYGEIVMLRKMFFLLMWNWLMLQCRDDLADILADDLMDNFMLMNEKTHSELMEHDTVTGGTNDHYLLYNKISGLISLLNELNTPDMLNLPLLKNYAYSLLETIAQQYGSETTDIDFCIINGLYPYFTYTEDTYDYVDLNISELNLPIKDLLITPAYAQYEEELTTSLKNLGIKGKGNWIDLLQKFIINAKIGDGISHSIFNCDGNYCIPFTPFEKGKSDNETFTLYEAFRIFQMITDYLETLSFDKANYPQIFSFQINKWQDYVDNLPSTIKERYPIFIILYKILVIFAQKKIKEIIVGCIKKLIGMIMNEEYKPTDKIKVFREFYEHCKPLDDAYMYNLLIPSLPNEEDFAKKFLDLKNNEWNYNNILVKKFSDLVENSENLQNPTLLKFLGDQLYYYFYDTTNSLNSLRFIIEENRDYDGVIEKIITQVDFRDIVNEYLKSQKSLSVYNKITDTIKLNNHTKKLFEKKKNNEISNINFLTEFYGYVIVTVKQKIIGIKSNIGRIQQLITNIVHLINNEIYYYVAQILLPLLIIFLTEVMKSLDRGHKLLVQFTEKKVLYFDEKFLTSQQYINIVTLGEDFSKNIDEKLKYVYDNLLTIVKYHNDVINFLNSHSAYMIITTKQNFFDYNLIPIETLPDMYPEMNTETLKKILEWYRIPLIKYYSAMNPTKNIKTILQKIFHDNCNLNPYLNITKDPKDCEFFYSDHNLNRIGVVSNCPADGKNSQLNFELTEFISKSFNINKIVTSISGEWLGYSKNGTLTFKDAFIAYLDLRTPYQENYQTGAPPSIRNFAPQYIKWIKQKIIEYTIQFIIDNHAKPDTDTSKNPELVKLYDSVKDLGNESTFSDLDSAKIYVIIGTLVDSILNKLLELAIREGITSWVYELVVSGYNFYGPVHNISSTSSTIAIIRKRDYLKLSLNDVNKNSIEDLLKTNPKYVDTKLSQIEPNPSNIKFSTPPIQTDMIHYLYNINIYFTDTSTKKCYQISPTIISKLITGETINSKNSDGNTPLHMAVRMCNPTIVEILISHGAKPKSFVDLHKHSPYDIAISDTLKHINYITGTNAPNTKVIDTLNSFVVPFNDMLLSKLKDEKYGNNIIKNILYGIPIELVIYNHMFYMYLQNYRYRITIKLKNSIFALIFKYLGIGDQSTIYPIDLFVIDNYQQLINITETEIIENSVIKNINSSNQKKLKMLKKQRDDLQIQLDELQKEKSTTIDANKINMIDNLIKILQKEKDPLNYKINSSEILTPPIIDQTLMNQYIAAVNNILPSINQRIVSVIEFYNLAFKKIGNTQEMYLAIWNNYLHRNYMNTPSMIFSILHIIILEIINLIKQNKSVPNTDLDTLVSFFEIVKNYIESKDSYPTNFEDNPILNEEREHIKYLINLILTPSIYNILLNHIYEALSDMDAAQVITGNQTKILDEIAETEFNGLTIKKYLEEILPNLAIKYFTTIYDGSNDPNRKITGAYDLFLPIIQTIKASKILLISDDSPIIQNMRDYVIPFMINTYQNFIHYIRFAIFGYEKYLLNTYQLVEILRCIVKNG